MARRGHAKPSATAMAVNAASNPINEKLAGAGDWKRKSMMKACRDYKRVIGESAASYGKDAPNDRMPKQRLLFRHSVAY